MQGTRIGEVLRQMGVITDRDVERILVHQRCTRQKFGQIAVRWGLATQEQIWEAWARQFAARGGWDPTELGSDTAALEAVPRQTCRRLGIVPLRRWGQHLVVAATGDLTAHEKEQLARESGCQIHVCASEASNVQKHLKSLKALPAA